MTHKKIAIIAGAGPAGLTTAYELLKRTDIQPIVFESTDAIGGIAQTFNYKGNRIDIGGHRFFSKIDRVMKWWFNILPPQGAPAADTAAKQHEIEYAVQVTMEYLCPEVGVGGDGVEKGLGTLDKGQGNEIAHVDGVLSSDHPAQKGHGTKDKGHGKSHSAAHHHSTPKSKVPLPTSITRAAPDPEKEDNVMLQRPRVSRIFYRKHFFPYPIGITFLVARRLGIINTFLIGMSYIKAQMFPLADETFLDSFYINRFGRRLYKTFFEAYTEKVWGVPCSQIRADWGAQRVKGLSLKRALTHAIRDLLSSDFAKSQRERETSLITRFFYPKFGPGQMWEVVAKQIAQCGGSIEMRKRISSVHVENGAITSVMVEDMATGELKKMACDYFFSTMPIKHLIGMMTPHPPALVTEVAEGLQYRDFLTVGLLLKKLNVIEKGKPVQTDVPDNWIYIQDGGVRVGRVQIFNNWSPYMVADSKNTKWIGLEYFVNEGGDLWVMPDKDLIELGITEMEKVGLLSRSDVLDGCILRMPKAYPAYFGSYDQIDTVRHFVDAIPNLFLIGRNGMHRYNNQDHSMLTAMLAVDNIIAGVVDKANLWDVNLEMEYHEEKKA
ncbi:MAG: NAD(P)/FAD-dependent oxidoreductase [Candidatus Peribacteraceae bacterium]|nr:NAD(P)/FAD-dependent oxidoreductase [Candidatus Peribacteraceae bacterium]